MISFISEYKDSISHPLVFYLHVCLYCCMKLYFLCELVLRKMSCGMLSLNLDSIFKRFWGNNNFFSIIIKNYVHLRFTFKYFIVLSVTGYPRKVHVIESAKITASGQCEFDLTASFIFSMSWFFRKTTYNLSCALYVFGGFKILNFPEADS